MIKLTNSHGCTANFDINHEYKLYTALTSYYQTHKSDSEIQELISGLAFVITQNFECLLPETKNKIRDSKITSSNIRLLANYFKEADI